MQERTFPPPEINYANEAAIEKPNRQLENQEVVAAQILSAQDEHIMTIPNGMTAFRAGMAVALPIMMAKGNKYAPLVAGVAAASDKESTVADLIDRRFPGWGRSELGARIDPIADTVCRSSRP